MDPLDILVPGSSIIGSAISADAAEGINAKQLHFQHSENVAQREFTKFLQDQGFKYDQAKTLWEAEYNKPYNQMDRLRKAGINPFVAAELMTGSAVNSGNVTTPASVNSGSGFSPLGSVQLNNPVQNYVATLSALSDLIGNLANARKAGAETKSIETQLPEIVKGLSLDNASKTIDNNIKYMWGHKKEAAVISELNSRMHMEFSQAANEERQADYYYNKAKEVLTDIGVKENEIDKYERTIDYMVAQYMEAVKTQQAQTNYYNTGAQANQAQAQKSYAEAAKAFAEAQTENEKRQFIVSNAKDIANMSNLEVRKFQQEFWDKVNLTHAEKQIADATFEMIMQTKDFNKRYDLIRGLGTLLGGSVSIQGRLPAGK